MKPTSIKRLLPILVFAGCLILAACGTKGDLVRPGTPAPAAAAVR